jgi:signal peptidase I
MDSNSPPLPLRSPQVSSDRRNKFVIGLALIPAVFVGALIILRIFGMVRPFYVPNGAMTPAVSAGDHVVMDGLTFLARKPHSGDIVVFKSDGIALLAPATLYIKRVAGEPGERLRLSEGKLFINDKLVALSNAVGEIVYGLFRHVLGVFH